MSLELTAGSVSGCDPLSVNDEVLTVSLCDAPANPHDERPSCNRAVCSGRKLRGCGLVRDVSGARRE